MGRRLEWRRTTVFFAISEKSETQGPEVPERLRLRMASISSTDMNSRDFSPSFMVTIE